MKKIEGLYRSYCHERELEMQEYHTGGSRMKELQEFLKSKLNAEDYFTAEEMLNNLIAETEEKGFAAGAKYTAERGAFVIKISPFLILFQCFFHSTYQNSVFCSKLKCSFRKTFQKHIYRTLNNS